MNGNFHELFGLVFDLELGDFIDRYIHMPLVLPTQVMDPLARGVDLIRPAGHPLVNLLGEHLKGFTLRQDIPAPGPHLPL